MALRVWLPLNGNINNYGISGVSVTNNGANVDNNGKIGKCYNFDGTDDRISATTQYVSSYPISIAAWIYPTNVSSTTTQYILSYNTATGGTAGHLIGLGFYGGSNLAVWYGGSVTNTSKVLNNNTWYHICATIDISKNIKVYVDGQDVYSGTASSTPPDSRWLTFGARSNSSSGGTGGAAYFYKGKLNDVRIYDHCLSAKEVKEISKGLVLHYPLKDQYIDNTTNINSYIEQGIDNVCYNGYSGKYNYGTNTDMYKITGEFQGKKCTKVYMGTAGNNAWPFVHFSPLHPANNSYKTLSFDYYSTSQDKINFYTHGGGATLTSTVNGVIVNNGTMTIKLNQWNHITVTLFGTSSSTSGWGYMKIGTNSHTSTTTDYWLFANVQIEEKDHATPYTSSSRSETTVYDCSGYSNNGTKSGTITYESNSPRYSGCLTFDAKAHIKIPKPMTIGNTSQFTVSMWVKPESGCGGYAIVASNYNYPANGFWMAINTEGSGTWFYNGTYAAGNPLLTVGSWHHIVMVFNVGTITWYTNGVATTTSNVSSRTTQFTDYIALGNSYTGTSWNTNFVGSISDFRIYATALSNADIKELYNTAMSIDKAGNIYTYEYKEIE